ncbi:uncharacterized protein LOC118285561 [Scophthalmus maximus]|uniref:Integrase core domain-containing protein n=1 Tax=Scophthalmus maximus TaxID=52904 RepID=A0A8D3AF45_SCOMX|nr:uncharacterized protein LOC118285561 [Scophthalmus maximus]
MEELETNLSVAPDDGDGASVSFELPSTPDNPGTSTGSQVSDRLFHLFTLLLEGKKLPVGRPKLDVSRDELEDLIDMDLSVPCISRTLGISVKTVRRRMQQWGLSIKESYSKVTDDELDFMVAAIRADSPNLGQRMMKGRLKALGHRVQWTRVWESMHRVDKPAAGDGPIDLGCDGRTRTTNGDQAPLSLVHVNTNHELIRYGIVMFGGIAGFSRKILYLRAANNNRPSTALDFFQEAVDTHGFPSRVRGDQSLKNAEIARHMLEVSGCGRGSFTPGSSDRDQRIDHLWRDVWKDVSSIYHDLLHSLEEDALLDPENHTHLFCAQYVFLPRIQRDLDAFADRWNNCSLHTERDLTPNQLWEQEKTVGASDDVKEDIFPGVKITDMDQARVLVPEVESPLGSEELDALHQLFSPTAPSLCFGADVFCAVVHYVDGVRESRQEAHDSN